MNAKHTFKCSWVSSARPPHNGDKRAKMTLSAQNKQKAETEGKKASFQLGHEEKPSQSKPGRKAIVLQNQARSQSFPAIFEF